MSNPIVTVSVICYNQEKFIEQCIDSILSQETDFEYKILISDDCSTDLTPHILKAYKAKHPDKVDLNLRTHNVGLVRNAIENILAIKSKYVALLEGDDFWLDSNKLQIQIQTLEDNEDCSISFTNGIQFHDSIENGKEILSTKQCQKIGIEEFLSQGILIPNNSKVFRRNSVPQVIPDWYYQTHMWDWSLHLFNLQKGMAIYSDIIGLAYRRHDNAFIHSTKDKDLMLNSIKARNHLNDYFDGKYSKYLLNRNWQYKGLYEYFMKNGEVFRGTYYFIQLILKTKNFRYLKDYLYLLKKVFE